jgi:hypothetical protein
LFGKIRPVLQPLGHYYGDDDDSVLFVERLRPHNCRSLQT